MSAIKDLIANMHLGGCRVIKYLTGRSQHPALTNNFLQELSRAPEWVEEVKRSACRKGVIQALTLCKVYHPNVDPSRLTLGFPELKVDGSKYQPSDYYRVAKDVRHHATKIADELKLDSFEPGYDQDNKKRVMPAPKAVSLKVTGGKSTIGSSTSFVLGKDTGGEEEGKSLLPPPDTL